MFFFLLRSDCVEILKKCGDQNKFPEAHTAESICEFLSPADDVENCIPLDTYLSKYCVGLVPLPLFFPLDEELLLDYTICISHFLVAVTKIPNENILREEECTWLTVQGYRGNHGNRGETQEHLTFGSKRLCSAHFFSPGPQLMEWCHPIGQT